jgi:hypothetical protein
MRPWEILQFLTFVLLAFAPALALSAPQTKLPPSQIDSTAPAPADGGRLEKETTQVTPRENPPSPEELERIQATRFVREKTWNVAAGLWSGVLQEKEAAISTQVLSLTQTSMNEDESSYEYGVDVTAKGHFGWHGQYKEYCCMGQWFEPYWTVGIGGLYKPSELLAGLIKPSSYQVQAGGGLEDLFRAERRIRVELLIAQGLPGTSFLVRFGYAFDEDFLNF